MTIEDLNEEYAQWISKHGTGRDSIGIRFGQHIYNKFGVEFKNSHSCENAEYAFILLYGLFEEVRHEY